MGVRLPLEGGEGVVPRGSPSAKARLRRGLGSLLEENGGGGEEGMMLEKRQDPGGRAC